MERGTIARAQELGVGGFILFGGTRPGVTAITHTLVRDAGRPLLIGADLERGPGQQVRGLTELPPPSALGYINDLDATYAAGMITATEARSVGINWTFAPVCDLDIEPRNPIVQTRSFGSDLGRVNRNVAAWIRGCQEHGVMACAKHYPGHGRTTLDSHAGLPVVDAPAAELQSLDVDPFAVAIASGVGSVMPAHVAYTGWDATGVAATFSRPILGFLRGALGFTGLVVTDAFIMAGATAAAPEGMAAVAAINAGCDMLLYPTDWAGVVRALERVEVGRAEAAVARYEEALGSWASGRSTLEGAELAEHQQFADVLADRALHLVRGVAPSVRGSVSVTIVDDDVGGPYLIPPRDVFAKTLAQLGVGVVRQASARTQRIVVVYAEPRSWKGRGDLGEQTLAQLARVAPNAALVVLFGHPRLAAQIPGDAPILCGWHGMALMQRAGARWVKASA